MSEIQIISIIRIIALVIAAIFYVLLMAGCMLNPNPGGQAVTKSQPRQQPIAPYTPGNKTPYKVFDVTYTVLPESLDYLEIGVASWYGKKFHGKLTANGDRYDMYQLSGAHKTLPIPTMVKVTNLDNGLNIKLKINDRGPFHEDRIIDLSYAAAKQLGFVDQGTAPVVVEALDEVEDPKRSSGNVNEQPTYLQLGAFSRLELAHALTTQVEQLLSSQAIPTQIQILPVEKQQQILYRIWLGPIKTSKHHKQIIQLLAGTNLSHPVPVQITLESNYSTLPQAAQ